MISRSDRVGCVTISRPDRLNALSVAMTTGIVDAICAFSDDPSIWAVLIRAEGDRSFCAGMDLKEMHAQGSVSGDPMIGRTRNVFEAVLECTKPTVAAVFGWTLGAGCELALACDIRVAANDLQIGLPEAKRGLGANFASQVLPRVVPMAVAYEMLYTGEPIGAVRAMSIGLVNEVVPKEQLSDRAEHFARKVASNAPLSVQRYKAMVSKGRDLPLAAALRLHVGPNPYVSGDREEGVAAFVENRPPIWRGR